MLVVSEGPVVDDDGGAAVLENGLDGVVDDVVVDLGMEGVVGGVELVVSIDAGGKRVVVFDDERGDASIVGQGPDFVDASGVAVRRPGLIQLVHGAFCVSS